MSAGPSAVEQAFRDHSGKAIASLVRRFGDIDVAEEAVQEAFLLAVRQWESAGPPPNPEAWIITTARHRALDRLRREGTRDERQAEAVRLAEREPAEVTGPVADERLRLIFTCCHPALAQPARVALTLRLLGGLSTAEIARAFLVPEATMAQRLVRAKAKIKAARIPYRVPEGEDLGPRLAGVLAVLYLVFNEGYLASTGSELTRSDLSAEAIRLTRVLVGLMPEAGEAQGLLALMLLTEARRPARTDPGGALVLLGDQDRTRWDRGLIDEGHRLVRHLVAVNAPGPYQIQAAIQAVHTDAPSAEATPWAQIVMLYDQLLAFTDTPVVRLNRAVAVAEVAGPEAGLALIDPLAGALDSNHLFHSVRADLLRRTGDTPGARASYDRALALVENQREGEYLVRRRADLDAH